MKAPRLLVNVDVGDLAQAERFYCAAFGLTVGRRFDGALEKDIATAAWGRIALLADPFGNGFCLVEFSARGYDAIALT